MKIIRANLAKSLNTASGGGQNFGVPEQWSTGMYGSGWPIAPVSAPKDVQLPREIDYPIMANFSLSPRSGYEGLMSFASIDEAYENVTEVKMPISLILREMTTFVPKLVDHDHNEIEDHPYKWMTTSPDRTTPFSVWLTRFLKSTKKYDAPAIYLQDSADGVVGMHYVDGSTLLLIVDYNGRKPQAQKIDDYIMALPEEARHKYVSALKEYQIKHNELPTMVPAYTQVIKGTPFAWWSADQIWYQPQSIRTNAPYGESFIEQAWADIMLVVDIKAFELGHYRTGNMPEGFVTLPKDMYGSVDRIQAAEMIYNSRMSSNPATERMRLRMFPEGTTYIPTKKPDFPAALYTQAWKNILHTIGIPPSEFGDIPGSGLGGKGFKEGAASDLSRNTLNPHQRFIETPFNDVLKRDGVDDAFFELGYPQEEIDPGKLKQQVYDGMAHGTYTLNDALGQLGNSPVEGSMTETDDGQGNKVLTPILSHIANKHLLVAGSSIYVLEDLQASGGLAIPTGKVPGGLPVNEETAVNPDGKPAQPGTLDAAIKNIMELGKPSSKTISIPAKTPATLPAAPDDIDPDVWQKGLIEEGKEHPSLAEDVPQIVEDHLKEDPEYYKLQKHCGTCPDDDLYFGAPIAREFNFPILTASNHVNYVEIVAACPDGLPSKPFAWKPAGGESDDLQERVGGPLYVREEAAYLLDRSLGFALVPVSYVAEASDGEIGAAIFYVAGKTAARDPLTYAPEWIEKAAVLDYIMGQVDRGYLHNYLTHPDDPTRIIIIDSGLSFPVMAHDIKSPFCDAMNGKELSPATMAAVKKCSGDAATWHDIYQLVGKEAGGLALERINELVKTGKIVYA